MWRAGVSLSFHTDNQLMSCITHSSEALALILHTPLQVADLVQMGLQAARHSFMPEAAREYAAGALRGWAINQGMAMV